MLPHASATCDKPCFSVILTYAAHTPPRQAVLLQKAPLQCQAEASNSAGHKQVDQNLCTPLLESWSGPATPEQVLPNKAHRGRLCCCKRHPCAAWQQSLHIIV